MHLGGLWKVCHARLPCLSQSGRPCKVHSRIVGVPMHRGGRGLQGHEQSMVHDHTAASQRFFQAAKQDRWIPCLHTRLCMSSMQCRRAAQQVQVTTWDGAALGSLQVSALPLVLSDFVIQVVVSELCYVVGRGAAALAMPSWPSQTPARWCCRQQQPDLHAVEEQDALKVRLVAAPICRMTWL